MKRNKLSNSLVLIGIVILLIPIAGKAYVHMQQQKMLESYQRQVKENLNEVNDTFADEVQSTEAAIGAVDEEPNAKVNSEKMDLEKVIGRIKISGISVDIPLLEGASSKELKWGAGHLSGTALPGQEGNCAVAAHRNYTFGTYFNRLGEVKEGDEVTVEYGGKSYTYTVEKTFLVLPDEVSVLDPPSDGSILTLITCAPQGGNTHRLIVQAALTGGK